MTILNKLIFILTPKERKSAVFLLLMILVMALIDVIGVASILPFMSVLVNPSLIETNFVLIKLFEFFKGFGVENNQQFFFVLGTLVFIILITFSNFVSFNSGYIGNEKISFESFSVIFKFLTPLNKFL